MSVKLWNNRDVKRKKTLRTATANLDLPGIDGESTWNFKPFESVLPESNGG